MADDDKEKKEKKKKEFKRGKVKRPMLVYHYGGKPHKSSLDLCWWAARGGHRYFNTLVEIERKRRTEFQEARTRLFPDLDRLETEVKNRREELKEIRTEIKLRNQRARRRTGTPEDRARVAALKKQLKPFNNLLKVMRASYNVHPEMQAAAKNISATAKASVKAARHNADTNWGCVDEETEILTSQGWKKNAEFQGTEQVATYNLETNLLEWQTAQGKTSYHYVGPMARVKNARLDMLLTPNHRVVFRKQSFRTGAAHTRTLPAEEMPISCDRVYILQAASGLNPADPLSVSPAEAAVLGWVIAEGHFFKDCAAVSLSQSQRVNPAYCQMIRDVLCRAGLSFAERVEDEDGMVSFYIPADSARWIRHWIPDKLLTPELVFGLSQEAAEQLYAALLCGDGSRCKTSTGKARWRFIQKNQQNVSLFQALALRLGLATHAHDRSDGISSVNVRLQPYALWLSRQGSMIDWVPFEGTVWCPSTPNTTWVARRKGTIFITGNSYLQMEQATEAAFDCVGLPKFKPWRGEGLVAVQLQHGATVAQLTDAEKGQASLTIHPQTTRRSDRRRATLRMRLDSEGRKPVWASVDFVYHRPIPADAKILWILLKLYRDGTKHRWEVNFVCTRSAGFDRDDRATTGLVGVDFGWRKRADGSLRVAYWAESATKHGELVLPADVFDRAGQAEFLQSEADKVFNRARTELADWLRDRNLPDWLRERTLQLGHWRSGGRLIGVLMAWRAERFTGDEEAFDRLSEWYQVYRRLIDRAAIQRRSLQNARLYLYRQWARDWAKTYGQVNLEDADWRILARAAQAEAPTDHDRYCMRLASPGLLRRIILEAIGKEGVHLVETPGTTRTCHLCGHYNTWEKPKELYQRCQNPLCNQLWDQDYNAALVILGR